MQPHRCARFGFAWYVAVAFLAAGVALTAAAAEVVILKDGFAIQGHVIKEQTSVRDPWSSGPVILAKANGFDMLDDGPRFVIFSKHARQLGEVNKNIKLRPDSKAYIREMPGRKGNDPLPAGATPNSSTEYNAKWHRTLKVNVPGAFELIEQQITYIDPYHMRIVSPTHLWRVGYRTSEMDPTFIRKLLLTHPDLAQVGDKLEASKRIALAKFMLDAGWLQLAKDDIDQLHKDFPNGVPKASKEAYDALVKEVDVATAALVIKEADLALAAGRYGYAAQLLRVFPEKLADKEQIAKAVDLRARRETTQEHYSVAQRLLRALVDEATGLDKATPLLAVGGTPAVAIWPTKALSGTLAVLAAAGQTVLHEMHPDSVHRLETFVSLASQADREKLQGHDPTKTPVELLAVAASGWAKGKNGATEKPDLAVRIWQAREAVLGYQRAPDLNTRNRILNRYKSSNPVSIDELAQIISLLPPAEPENLLFRTGTPVVGKEIPPELYKRSSAPTTEHAAGIPYLVKLPPEYHHGRAYPVVIVLPHPGMAPEQMIAALSYEADRNGYILLAPEWSGEFGKGWQWRGEDHAYVTDVLRDAIRHFCVDNDRVFLFGALDGANMAMDIGMSHPDLFAGVLAMAPIPKWKNLFAEYWRNAQKLPFYVATGEMSGDSAANLRQIYERWMPNGFPGLMVLYKGRGLEWFPAEIPVMFDWMGRKKRANGTSTLQLGTGPRFPWTTMRSTDNKFYWLGADKITERHMVDNLPPGRLIVPAEIQGDILAGNLITVRSRGVTELSIWLGQAMIDWTKPVRVNLNGRVPPGYRPKVMEPDLNVLLDDYRDRGDRRMLYMARLEFNAIP